MSFEDFTSKSSDKTSVWHHFLRGKDEAKCKICKKVLKSAGGTTTGLRKHLKSVHLLNLRPENETEPGTSNSPRPSSASHQEEPTNKRSKLTDFFKPTQENSISDRICRMLSLDGVPIRLFTESYDLRDVFDKAGIPLPKSANTVREIMLKEYENKRNDLIAEIKQLKSEDKNFPFR